MLRSKHVCPGSISPVPDFFSGCISPAPDFYSGSIFPAPDFLLFEVEASFEIKLLKIYKATICNNNCLPERDKGKQI